MKENRSVIHIPIVLQCRHEGKQGRGSSHHALQSIFNPQSQVFGSGRANRGSKTDEILGRVRRSSNGRILIGIATCQFDDFLIVVPRFAAVLLSS